MKQIRTLFGLEAETRFEAFHPDGSRDTHALRAVEKICCEGIRHLDGEERGVFLGNGGNWYPEAAGDYEHQEFSTPECTNPTDAVLYSEAGYHFARRGAAIFAERNGGRACFSRSNVCYSAQTSWGNHECYCTNHSPDSLADALFGHFASRIIYSGAGGFDAKSAGLDFVLSSRVPFIGAIRSGSTEGPGRALFHKDYKSPRGHGGKYRMHIICGDGLCSERALWLRTATTALMVALADHGRMPGRPAKVSEPLAALHAINADPLLKAAVYCEDGKLRTALDIQSELLGHVEQHVEILPPWAPDAVFEWRRVLESLATDGLAGPAGSHDVAIKHDLYSAVLAQRGFHFGGVTGNAAIATGKAGKAELKRIRTEMMLLDTRFSEMSENGLFEILDTATTPHLLDHRIPGVKERVEWAMENPPTDTRAAARGAIVRQYSGTAVAEQLRVGWSFAVDNASGRKLDLSDPFDSKPTCLGEFDPKPRPADPAGKPGAARRFREMIGI
ncbi:MAG: proteasome accessory factor PafA2 family protein [Chthoniobacteraceae bacterium]